MPVDALPHALSPWEIFRNNLYARGTAAWRALLGEVMAEILRLVSRDFARCALPLREAAEKEAAE